MTGPEHYREAERIMQNQFLDLAAAQVHATLALAAATIDAADRRDQARRRAVQQHTATIGWG